MNGTNKGTGWTPCHCAAFQGHGKALLHLIQRQPDVTIRDSMGRYTGVEILSDITMHAQTTPIGTEAWGRG